MNLAITLLVALAIASVIGTVLQQNQPYNNYISKFGPFWFEVFERLGLYDIYGSGWFLALLGFLLVSTAVCVWRNTPAMLRDMQQFRLDAQRKSLSNLHHAADWCVDNTADIVLQRAAQYLQSRRYRVRRKDHDEHSVIAGMTGASNRLAYILSHVAIVVICLGGLIDGNLPLKFRLFTGDVVTETRDLPVSEVPDKAILSPDNDAFRASVSIPEGARSDYAFLSAGEGYLVQRLPFEIELEDFRIEHYATGQPKSFESDLVIHDPQRETPVRKTISVNHPLVYRGYSIYQASFRDGGTKLRFRVWPLQGEGNEPFLMAGRINDGVRLQTPQGPRRAEFMDFKPFNIFPTGEEGDEQRNFGASVIYRLRKPSGEANEYVTYVTPVTLEDGRPYFVSGVRSSPGEPYRYLYLPVDPEGGLERFMRFRALAQDRETVAAVVARQLGEAAANEQLAGALTRMVSLFSREGFDAVVERIRATFPADKAERAVEGYVGMLRQVYGALYRELLRQEGVDQDDELTDAQLDWLDAAMNAFSVLGAYGAPVYLDPMEFEHIQASGLQVTRSPGKSVVYLGCVLLMAGVFLMFYIRHRRLWVWVAAEDGETRVVFAGSSDRERVDFGPEFETMAGELKQLLEAPAAPTTD